MKIFKRTILWVGLGLAGLVWVAFNNHDDPPVAGDTAPDFTLLSNEGSEITLSDFKGQWVILYFYPKDFTSGCTIQAHNFQRDIEQYRANNAVILGVSVDSVESHAEFCAKEGLDFKLLSDMGGDVSSTYGSIRGVGKAVMSARNTFLINPEGTISKVYLSVSVNPHSEEVLTDIASFQSAEG